MRACLSCSHSIQLNCQLMKVECVLANVLMLLPQAKVFGYISAVGCYIKNLNEKLVVQEKGRKIEQVEMGQLWIWLRKWMRCAYYHSSFFCDFPLIARSGKCHVMISLTGSITPGVYAPDVNRTGKIYSVQPLPIAQLFRIKSLLIKTFITMKPKSGDVTEKSSPKCSKTCAFARYNIKS